MEGNAFPTLRRIRHLVAAIKAVSVLAVLASVLYLAVACFYTAVLPGLFDDTQRYGSVVVAIRSWLSVVALIVQFTLGMGSGEDRGGMVRFCSGSVVIAALFIGSIIYNPTAALDYRFLNYVSAGVAVAILLAAAVGAYVIHLWTVSSMTVEEGWQPVAFEGGAAYADEFQRGGEAGLADGAGAAGAAGDDAAGIAPDQNLGAEQGDWLDWREDEAGAGAVAGAGDVPDSGRFDPDATTVVPVEAVTGRIPVREAGAQVTGHVSAQATARVTAVAADAEPAAAREFAAASEPVAALAPVQTAAQGWEAASGAAQAPAPAPDATMVLPRLDDAAPEVSAAPAPADPFSTDVFQQAWLAGRLNDNPSTRRGRSTTHLGTGSK